MHLYKCKEKYYSSSVWCGMLFVDLHRWLIGEPSMPTYQGSAGTDFESEKNWLEAGRPHCLSHISSRFIRLKCKVFISSLLYLSILKMSESLSDYTEGSKIRCISTSGDDTSRRSLSIKSRTCLMKRALSSLNAGHSARKCWQVSGTFLQILQVASNACNITLVSRSSWLDDTLDAPCLFCVALGGFEIPSEVTNS